MIPSHASSVEHARPHQQARRAALFAARLLAVLGTAFSAVCSAADDAPRGEVTKYSFEQSKIFPGTFRDYWVYVPKQYDPAKPACVYVNQDGIQYNAPQVFDDLIAKRRSR